MKYAFMTYSCPDLDLDAVLETAVRYRYDAVEPRLSSGHGHGLEFDTDAAGRREAKQKAERAGVEIGCIATSCRFSDPATVESAVEDAHQALDLAADVGASRIRVFGGVIAEGLSREGAVAQVIESMHRVKDHAAERKVAICFETHDDWCEPTDLVRVMEAVSHPSVRINWDLMHPVFTAGRTMDEAFDILRPWIAHVHVHDCVRQDGERVMVPIGEGMIDHRRAFELLQSVRYAGLISGEWIRWKPPEEHLGQELATLREYETGL